MRCVYCFWPQAYLDLYAAWEETKGDGPADAAPRAPSLARPAGTRLRLVSPREARLVWHEALARLRR